MIDIDLSSGRASNKICGRFAILELIAATQSIRLVGMIASDEPAEHTPLYRREITPKTGKRRNRCYLNYFRTHASSTLMCTYVYTNSMSVCLYIYPP